MPRLCSSAPCFPVADVGATVRWYEEHLGFRSYPFPKTEPYAFASLVRDEVEIMRNSSMAIGNLKLKIRTVTCSCLAS